MKKSNFLQMQSDIIHGIANDDYVFEEIKKHTITLKSKIDPTMTIEVWKSNENLENDIVNIYKIEFNDSDKKNPVKQINFKMCYQQGDKYITNKKSAQYLLKMIDDNKDNAKKQRIAELQSELAKLQGAENG